MSNLRIGLVQMLCPKGEMAKNLESIDSYLVEGIARHVDFMCFPEVSITGYINPTRMPEAVLTLESKEVEQFVHLTAGNSVTAIAGIVEENPKGKPFITQLVASSGKLLGCYRKINVAEDEQAWFSAGSSVQVFRQPQVDFGIAICADIDREEIFAECARRGVRIVFVAAAPGLYGPQETRNWQAGFDWWQNNCKEKLSRYAENYKIHIAVATQTGRTIDEDFPGGGYVFGPSGTRVGETPDRSQSVLYATLELQRTL